MDISPITWLPDSPFRVPSWRFARASWLQERGKRASRRFDDEWVARAWRFMTTESRSSRTSRLDSVIAMAAEISREGDGTRRWQIEAFLLTSEPMEKIADRVHLPVEVIHAYHQLFFDVRPHLRAGDWIMSQAIGTWHAKGFAGMPIGALWKYFGYIGGPIAVEILIALTTDAPFPEWVRETFTDQPAYEERRLRVLGKLVIGALTATSSKQWEVLIEARTALRKLDHEVTGTLDQPTDLLPVMEKFLSSIGQRRKPRGKANQVNGKEPALPDEAKGTASPRVVLESLLASLGKSQGEKNDQEKATR
jgi:hypothetical protein